MGHNDVPFPCTSHWSRPSATNTLEDCDPQTLLDWVNDYPIIWLCAVPIVISVFFIFPTSCFLLCGRYCCNCCGASKMRPSSVCGCGGEAAKDDQRPQNALYRMYSRNGVLAVKVCAGILAVLGLVAIILSGVGGGLMQKAVNDVLPTFDGIANWAYGVIDSAKRGIVDEDGNYPAGFDQADFDAVAEQIASYRGDVSDFMSNNKGILKIVTSSLAFAAVIPGFALFLPLIAAIGNIRTCLPITTALIGFFFQFVYLFAGSMYMIFFLALSIVCFDLSSPFGSSSSSSPSGHVYHSLTEWYLLPQCEEDAPFADIKRNVQQMETDAAVEGCTRLLDFCSTSVFYDAVNHPSQIYYCNLTTPEAQCRTVAQITAVINGMRIKELVPASEACGGRSNNTIPNSECTVEKCSKYCGNTEARDQSANALKELATGTRVLNTYTTTILPWLDCRTLLRKVIDTGAYDAVANVRTAVGFLRDGALVIGFAWIAAVIVSLLGQKRYFSHKLAGRGGAGGVYAVGEEERGWWNADSAEAAHHAPPNYAATDKIGGVTPTYAYAPVVIQKE